jgi:DNA repair protein RAD16
MSITIDYSNIFTLITRMRQMACHPDLVIRSRSNAGIFNEGEAEFTVCRLCNDVAEDAIQAKCHHVFDRECIKQYFNSAVEARVRLYCALFCRMPLTAPRRSWLVQFVMSIS